MDNFYFNKTKENAKRSASKPQMDKIMTTQNCLLDADKTLLEEFDFDDVPEIRVRGCNGRKQSTKPFELAKRNKWSRLALSGSSRCDSKPLGCVENNSQLKTGANAAHASSSGVTPQKAPIKSISKDLVQESNSKCNESRNVSRNAPLQGIGASSQLEKDVFGDQAGDVDFFKMVSIDANISQINFENNVPIKEQTTQTSVKQNTTQTEGSDRPKEWKKKRWDLKLLPEALESQETLKKRGRSKQTPSPACPGVTTYDFPETDIFNSFLEQPTQTSVKQNTSQTEGSDRPKEWKKQRWDLKLLPEALESQETLKKRGRSKQTPSPACPGVTTYDFPETDIFNSFLEQPTQTSVKQNTSQTEGSDRPKEWKKQRWDLKLLPEALESQETLKKRGRSKRTPSPACPGVTTYDFPETDIFNGFLEQPTQTSVKQNTSQTEGSDRPKEREKKRWDLKLLPEALESQETLKKRGRSKRTPSPACPGVTTYDFPETDIFKSFLEQPTHNKLIADVQSPILFSSSSDSDPRRTHSHGNNSQNVAKCKDNPNSARLISGKLNRRTSPQGVQKNSLSQFSQLFKSTQVVKQLDEAILREEQASKRNSVPNKAESFAQENSKLPFDNSANKIYCKHKSLENPDMNPNILKISGNEKNEPNDNFNNFNKSTSTRNENLTNNDIEYRMTQLLKSSQYRKEVSQLFQKMEHSICHLGPNQDAVVSNEKSGPNADWADDSFMADAMLNGLTQTENGSFNDMIKRALQENAKKDVQPKTLVNRTVVNPGATFKSLGPFYGLPDKVLDLIKLYKGIDKLYDWQDECLNLPAVNDRKNLIYSLPTSGGKTLVAEILILREIICRKRNVIFVLPYVAIVQEKVWALSPFAVALDFLIEEYAAGKGTYPPKTRRYKNSVFAATTEKALGLVNSLVEQGRLEELGLVVVDELHLIGDEQRGPKLEALLTKLMYLNEDIQIVGMSATIGNLPDIQQFLKAEVYTRNFRPVELTEHVKCGDQIAKINWSTDPDQVFEFARKVDFSYSEYVNKIDPDHLGGLVMEVVPKGACLIFCPTKRSCENVTRLLCKIVFPQLKTYKTKEKQQLISALKYESGTLCEILQLSVPFGIAYHHSGLTSEERKLIEEGYRTGVLSLICCTSTLAAGVNLPAKRVIIRKPFIANEFISLSRYKQMVGRAGRAGFGEKGESILICDKKELPKVRDLLVSPMDQTLSRMHENECSYLRNLFLSCISLGTANTKAQLQRVADMTLMAVQQKKLGVDVKQLIRKTMTDLFVLGAVQTFKESQKDPKSSTSLGDVSVYMNTPNRTVSMDSNRSAEKPSGSSYGKKAKRRIVLEANDKLVVSKLGSAAIKGCLELTKAHVLYEDLQKAQESLVLIDCLHLLYLVTPYNSLEHIKVEKNHLHSIMTKLGDRERKTASVLGITDFCIMRLYSNQHTRGVDDRILNKFYTALMLYDLWNEVPVVDVSEKYQINRGIVQNLMTNAASFASNVVSFCEELEEFWAFAHLLKGMSQRLAHCCCRELLPLMELPAVKQSRARQLYNAGFKNLQSIAKADPNDLVQAIEFMTSRLANQVIAAAKMLLLEKVETLREEAEDVLDGIEHPKLLFNQSFFK